MRVGVGMRVGVVRGWGAVLWRVAKEVVKEVVKEGGTWAGQRWCGESVPALHCVCRQQTSEGSRWYRAALVSLLLSLYSL